MRLAASLVFWLICSDGVAQWGGGEDAYDKSSKVIANKVFDGDQRRHQFLFSGNSLVVTKEGVTETFNLQHIRGDEYTYSNARTNGQVTVFVRPDVDMYGRMTYSLSGVTVSIHTNDFWYNGGLRSQKDGDDEYHSGWGSEVDYERLAEERAQRKREEFLQNVERHESYMGKLRDLERSPDLFAYFMEQSLARAPFYEPIFYQHVTSAEDFCRTFASEELVGSFYDSDLSVDTYLDEGRSVLWSFEELPSIPTEQDHEEAKLRLDVLKDMFERDDDEHALKRFWFFKANNLPLKDFITGVDNVFELDSIWNIHKGQALVGKLSKDIINPASDPQLDNLNQIGPGHPIWTYLYGQNQSTWSEMRSSALMDIMAYGRAAIGGQELGADEGGRYQVIAEIERRKWESIRWQSVENSRVPTFLESSIWNYDSALLSVDNLDSLLIPVKGLMNFFLPDADSLWIPCAEKIEAEYKDLSWSERDECMSMLMKAADDQKLGFSSGVTLCFTDVETLDGNRIKTTFYPVLEEIDEFNMWLEGGRNYLAGQCRRAFLRPTYNPRPNSSYDGRIPRLAYETDFFSGMNEHEMVFKDWEGAIDSLYVFMKGDGCDEDDIRRSRNWIAENVKMIVQDRQPQNLFRIYAAGMEPLKKAKLTRVLSDANFECQAIYKTSTKDLRLDAFEVFGLKQLRAEIAKEIIDRDISVKDCPWIVDRVDERDKNKVTYFHSDETGEEILEWISTIESRLQLFYGGDWYLKKATKTKLIYTLKVSESDRDVRLSDCPHVTRVVDNHLRGSFSYSHSDSGEDGTAGREIQQWKEVAERRLQLVYGGDWYGMATGRDLAFWQRAEE